jgi:shikimate dehydrogenase
MSSKQDFLPKLTGSLSEGAAGNPTVAMIEAAFAHHGLHWRYVNMEVPKNSLAAAVAGARAMGFQGFNCSLPHKVSVIEHLDGLGQSAEVMGAVNCVVKRGDKFIGENTDGKGFLRSLSSVVDPAGKSVVVLGAGGAARAVAVEMGLAGLRKITIVNRSASRGETLAHLLKNKLHLEAEFVAGNGDYTVPRDTDIVINATSIGLYQPEAAPALNFASLQPNMVVADVVFSPTHTLFLKNAEARGCQTVDGLGMLVNQGAIAIQYWTGIEPDTDIMNKALRQALGL